MVAEVEHSVALRRHRPGVQGPKPLHVQSQRKRPERCTYIDKVHLDSGVDKKDRSVLDIQLNKGLMPCAIGFYGLFEQIQMQRHIQIQ